ncbi:MAG: putative ABC transporter permease [Oscillospiraceae bacterium]
MRRAPRIFVNRGFLNGPVCPIYGFGVLIVLLVLEPVKDNLAPPFFGSMVLTSRWSSSSALSWSSSSMTKWADYSENPFTLGYICLEFARLGRGLRARRRSCYFHPMIFKLICAIPESQPLAYGLLHRSAHFRRSHHSWNMLKLPKRLRAIDELKRP